MHSLPEEKKQVFMSQTSETEGNFEKRKFLKNNWIYKNCVKLLENISANGQRNSIFQNQTDKEKSIILKVKANWLKSNKENKVNSTSIE